MAKDPKKITKFISKLLEILNQSKYQQIIKWTVDGTGVQILNRKLLQASVLIDHFKLKKVTSFIRQLHLYGFYKSKNEKKTNVFEHPLFVKSVTEGYHLIRRKYKQRNSESLKQSFETESSQEKNNSEVALHPELLSIKSLQHIFKGSSESRVCSNQIFFEEWYLNKEEDLSFFLDECLN